MPVTENEEIENAAVETVINDNLKFVNWLYVRRYKSPANPSAPNVAYKYLISVYDYPNAPLDKRTDVYHFNLPIQTTKIQFQLGNLQTENANGILDEALLAIVEDRLKSFQNTEFACVENEKALQHVQNALMWMLARKNNRQAQGVLDTYQKHTS